MYLKYVAFDSELLKDILYWWYLTEDHTVLIDN